MDIVEQLRGEQKQQQDDYGRGLAVLDDAADEIARLRDENARLLAERDDADRRAGAAEREQERDREAAYARDSWLRRAKEQWGVASIVSFDVVWDEALAAKKDAERYRWLRAERFDCDLPTVQSTETGCIGSTLQGDELDAAIDAAMQKGE